jgi:hypothetical protein
MSEKDGNPVDVSVDDDELIDVLDPEDEDLGDDAFDLDEELELDDQVIVQQFDPDELEAVDAGGLAFGVEDDMVDDLAAGDAGGLAFGVADDDEFEEEDEEREDEDDEQLLTATSFVGGALGGMTEERLLRLEEAARVLTESEVAREQRKVRRKVTAATGGAGLLGLIPIVLQLAGALDLDAELAATASTVAAIAGALGLGYLTPERPQPVAEAPATKVLLEEEDDDDEPRRRPRAGVAARRRRRRARSRRKARG